jgi:hypothetical protein
LGAGLASLASFVFARSPLMQFLEDPFAFTPPPRRARRARRSRTKTRVPLRIQVSLAEHESPRIYDLASTDMTWRRVRNDCVREAFWIWRSRP